MSAGIDTDFLVRLGIIEHPQHGTTVDLRDRLLDGDERFALAPQVLSEFIHVVTDPRRFERPLPVSAALAMAEAWWNAPEVDQILASSSAVGRFLATMNARKLGRKRILDTMLAATYLAAGVTRLITGNAADYRIFPDLELIEM